MQKGNNRGNGKRRRAKAKRAVVGHNGGPPLSLDNPPTGFTMSVDDLAQLTHSGRNGAYDALKAGTYPFIRQGRSIKVLTAPTLAILRGEMPPGGKRAA